MASQIGKSIGIPWASCKNAGSDAVSWVGPEVLHFKHLPGAAAAAAGLQTTLGIKALKGLSPTSGRFCACVNDF